MNAKQALREELDKIVSDLVDTIDPKTKARMLARAAFLRKLLG